MQTITSPPVFNKKYFHDVMLGTQTIKIFSDVKLFTLEVYELNENKALNKIIKIIYKVKEAEPFVAALLDAKIKENLSSSNGQAERRKSSTCIQKISIPDTCLYKKILQPRHGLSYSHKTLENEEKSTSLVSCANRNSNFDNVNLNHGCLERKAKEK
ncbi:CLUMA_CG002896, isoform A [Clunio marinus]|uniref:CLUMA_CG002896, isoform A n=1 Tax=Clunio marinus TaxID=568069 RepID=A0A1J1HM48_9DIPT|nr:CLUMA_CG002896, isoform A [Clunio marinus]